MSLRRQLFQGETDEVNMKDDLLVFKVKKNVMA